MAFAAPSCGVSVMPHSYVAVNDSVVEQTVLACPSVRIVSAVSGLSAVSIRPICFVSMGLPGIIRTLDVLVPGMLLCPMVLMSLTITLFINAPSQFAESKSAAQKFRDEIGLTFGTSTAVS